MFKNRIVLRNKYKILDRILYSSDPRTQSVKRSVLGVALLKGISVLTTFLLVPMTINYLNPVEYGIWLTLNSVLTWMNVFDFGLGHGLRNKVAEAYAVGNLKKVKIYISTAFSILSVISLCLFGIFFFVNSYVKWDVLLNIEGGIGASLNVIVLWVMFFFCLQFVVRLIGIIVTANQHPELNALITVVGSVFVLIVITLLTFFTKGSLLYVAIAFSAIPVLVYVLFSYLLFHTHYRDVRPSFRDIDMECIKDIVGLGGKFFIIQISAMVMMASSNIIISNLFGPSEVTVYNIVYKYFSVVTLLFAIIVTPLWSSFTNAYVSNDYEWIQKIMKQLTKIWMLSVVLTIFLLIFSNLFLYIWIGGVVEIPFMLSVLMACYVIIYNLHSLFISLINGTGKIFVQFLYLIFSMLFFIPVTIYLCRIWGVSGVVISMSAFLLPLLILSIIQYQKIISHRDIGIWSK